MHSWTFASDKWKLCSKKPSVYVCVTFQSNFLCYSPKLETTQMFLTEWMFKQTVIQSYLGILPSSQKEGNIDTCYNLKKISRELCWLQKLKLKNHIHDSTYNIIEMKNYRNERLAFVKGSSWRLGMAGMTGNRAK